MRINNDLLSLPYQSYYILLVDMICFTILSISGLSPIIGIISLNEMSMCGACFSIFLAIIIASVEFIIVVVFNGDIVFNPFFYIKIKIIHITYIISIYRAFNNNTKK